MSRSASVRRRPATLAEPHRWVIVVAYDISDDKRRARAANTILGYGGRVRASVYDVWVTRQQRERLWTALGKLAAKEDQVRMYPLCAGCMERVQSYGMESPQWTPALIV